jgi:hypothetical protein
MALQLSTNLIDWQFAEEVPERSGERLTISIESTSRAEAYFRLARTNQASGGNE